MSGQIRKIPVPQVGIFDVLLSDGQTVQIVTKGRDELELYSSVAEEVDSLYPNLYIIGIDPSDCY